MIISLLKVVPTHSPSFSWSLFSTTVGPMNFSSRSCWSCSTCCSRCSFCSVLKPLSINGDLEGGGTGDISKSSSFSSFPAVEDSTLIILHLKIILTVYQWEKIKVHPDEKSVHGILTSFQKVSVCRKKPFIACSSQAIFEVSFQQEVVVAHSRIHKSVYRLDNYYLSKSLGDPTSYFSKRLMRCPSSSMAEPQPQTRAKSLPVPRGRTETHTFSA